MAVERAAPALRRDSRTGEVGYLPDFVMAIESLESAIRGLGDDLARVSRRCHELRRAYQVLIETSANERVLPQPGAPLMSRLTRREGLVAALAAAGRTNAEIASELHVSLHTVKSQIRSVLRKLDVASRWQIRGAR